MNSFLDAIAASPASAIGPHGFIAQNRLAECSNGDARASALAVQHAIRPWESARPHSYCGVGFLIQTIDLSQVQEAKDHETNHGILVGSCFTGRQRCYPHGPGDRRRSHTTTESAGGLARIPEAGQSGQSASED